MWIGYTSLIISFVIISTILLLILVKSKISLIKKLIIISLSLWYSLALYFIPGYLSGWPSGQQIPDKSLIRDGFIREPQGSDPGAIYVWVISYKDNPFETIAIDPRRLVKVFKEGIPRGYELPYSKQTHKQITTAKKEKGKALYFRKKEGFKLIDQVQILKKDE